MALAAIAVLGVRATVAHACGGGGSDSGSSSSGSSGGGSDSSYYGGSGSVSEPACVDASDVNGYRTCTKYGDWGTAAALPAISFELSTWSAQVDLSDVDVSGTISHSYGPDYNYRVVGQDVGGEALATGVKVRLLGHKNGLYGGVESGVAAVHEDAAQQQMQSGDMLTKRVDLLFAGGVVLGAERNLGRVTLGAELMGGVRAVKVSAESHRGTCETIESELVPRGLVEARVRADLWVSPWFTVGAYAGRDVLGSQSTAGLGIGGHLRAFDGSR